MILDTSYSKPILQVHCISRTPVLSLSKEAQAHTKALSVALAKPTQKNAKHSRAPLTTKNEVSKNCF